MSSSSLDHVLDDQELLTRTFELAALARAEGDHPFGALLAVRGEIIAEAQNRVNTTSDITAHAELTLVRVLEQRGLLALLGEGTLFASCEPCPMCVGAMFWAGARRVVFGISSAKLTELATPIGSETIGFTVTASEIGLTASPPMNFQGPQREDEAAIAHLGFWHA